jgi:thiaminase/transcriptional activator TenA
MTRFSDELRAAAAPIWEAQHNHPFVRGIADGTLPKDRFVEWVKQDYVFLVEYCRLFAFAAGRAPDFETLVAFADLLVATANGEMNLHRRLAADLGISTADLEAVEPSPTTQGYTDFLVRTATTGDFAELAAALLPCMWGFSEIGQRLAARPRPADPQYAAWIESYADPEFAKLADWCRALVDRLAEAAPPRTRARMTRAFLTSSRYELLFWSSAWAGDSWPA